MNVTMITTPGVNVRDAAITSAGSTSGAAHI